MIEWGVNKVFLAGSYEWKLLRRVRIRVPGLLR